MDKPKTTADLIWGNSEPKKRGPKPLGQKAMTGAERKRRSRELAGRKREFSITVNGLHLDCVEAFAEANQVKVSDALRHIFDAALDRFVGVIQRSEKMIENGADDAAVAQFIKDNLYPPLPPFPKGVAEK